MHWLTSVGVMTPDVVNASSSGVARRRSWCDPLGCCGPVSGALSSPSTSPVGTSSIKLPMRGAEETALLSVPQVRDLSRAAGLERRLEGAVE